MIITPSHLQIIAPIPVKGWEQGENIVIKDANGQQWLLVDADDDICLFEAVEHREIGCSPRTRIMTLSAVQALFGWVKRDRHVRVSSEFGFGIEVYVDDEKNGFALAEPIWAERDNDPNWVNLDAELRGLARDCDRAANFELSALRGCGAYV